MHNGIRTPYIHAPLRHLRPTRAVSLESFGTGVVKSTKLLTVYTGYLTHKYHRARCQLDGGEPAPGEAEV